MVYIKSKSAYLFNFNNPVYVDLRVSEKRTGNMQIDQIYYSQISLSADMR